MQVVNPLSNRGNESYYAEPRKMMLSRVVREHFHEITEWRATAKSWSEINERLGGEALDHPPTSVRTLYHLELSRLKSPKRIAAFKWANNNYRAIKDLLNQNYNWTDILILNPLEPSNISTPTLNMLIAEFKAIDKARTAHQSGHSSPAEPAFHPTYTPHTQPLSPHPSPTTDAPHIEPHAPEPASELLATISNTKPLRDPSRSSNRATEAVISEEARQELTRRQQQRQSLRARFNEEAQARSARERAIAAIPPTPEYPKYMPIDDPYMSQEELWGKCSAAQAQRLELLNQFTALQKELKETPLTDVSDWSEIDALVSKRNELSLMADDAMHELEKRTSDFFQRYSDYRSTQSNLCLLSSSAIACGAYLIVDQESPGAISLFGYDRPEALAGMGEIPDPLYIKANLTNEELTTLTAAHVKDAQDFPKFDYGEPTSARLLAEALIVRGQYMKVGRDPILDPLKMVKLTGYDCPSPSLAKTEYHTDEPPTISLYPTDTSTTEVRP